MSGIGRFAACRAVRRRRAPAVGFAVALLLAGGLSAQDSGPSWGGLDFLIGTWEAKTAGGSAGAAASGAYVFRPELRGRVLARHSTSEGCKAPADFNCEHSDLLYIYPAAGAFKAIYFDNEGHVIQYDVSTPAPGAAVFLSAASAPGPQFRLSYELKDAVMHGRFQLRMPGQSEFRTYLEWSGAKR